MTDAIAFEDFPELIHLELRGNKLKTTPMRLNTPKIQRLYLGANELESLRFGSLTQLQVLNLRGNKLQSLDGLEKLTGLTYLNLRYFRLTRNNKIETVDQIQKLQKLVALKVLILLENPVESLENYRQTVVTTLLKLDRLDKEIISPEEREDALAALEPVDEATAAEAK